MFVWRSLEALQGKQFLVFERNPLGTGFGTLQELHIKDGVKDLTRWRWAPMLRDIYQTKTHADFDDEDRAKQYAVEQTIWLLARFGLVGNFP